MDLKYFSLIRESDISSTIFALSIEFYFRVFVLFFSTIQFIFFLKKALSLNRFYVITCITQQRHSKLNEFFVVCANELKSNNEWQRWFGKTFFLMLF